MFKLFPDDLKKEFNGYNRRKFSQDLIAGLSVAAVALPLSLAFGVSSGADAAAGLITAIIAGLFIGAIGSASYQISGPTGAMSAILITLSANYGIEGVFIAGMLSGIILIVAALVHAGQIVSIIPSAVITGFTSGIAIIIGVGQFDNFFGIQSSKKSIIAQFTSYVQDGFSPNWEAMAAGLIVILVMLIWPKKLQSKLPAALAGIITVLIVDVFVGFNIVTVGTIPKTLLHDQRLTLTALDFHKLEKLFVPAISIAALGMIQTLLCGAAAGKLKGKKLNADHELLAQGIGNVFIPFFGGVPATAAIARTIVGIKNGGQTRITSIVHSVTLIACIFLLGPVISRIPLAGLAGVLMVTAWRMNDWKGIKEFFRRRYKTSISQFIATMVATVVFDLTTAIIIGVTLSMVLFVMRSSYLEISVDNIDKNHAKGKNLTDNASGIKLVYVSGQIFFGSQDRIISCIHSLSDARSIVLSIRGVPSIDQSAMGELRDLWEEYKARGVDILFCGLQPQVLKMFERSGFLKVLGEKNVYQHAVEAIDSLSNIQKKSG
jgi:SulP family sulfate permease